MLHKPLYHCNSRLKQLYLSNKIGTSVIKVCERIHIKLLKVELAWAIDNLLQVISNKMLLSITKSS